MTIPIPATAKRRRNNTNRRFQLHVFAVRWSMASRASTFAFLLVGYTLTAPTAARAEAHHLATEVDLTAVNLGQSVGAEPAAASWQHDHIRGAGIRVAHEVINVTHGADTFELWVGGEVERGNLANSNASAPVSGTYTGATVEVEPAVCHHHTCLDLAFGIGLDHRQRRSTEPTPQATDIISEGTFAAMPKLDVGTDHVRFWLAPIEYSYHSHEGGRSEWSLLPRAGVGIRW